MSEALKLNVFETLNGLNINGRTEKKKVGNVELTYLSWPWAWAEVKKRFPDAHYEVWKDQNGRPYSADPETGYMVYTTVEIEGVTHEMWLPVMDGANNAMKSVPYEYKVKNPNFKWAKWDAERKGYYDKYGNEQPEYIIKSVNAATMFDINKTIMRCLVKNLAMFGLGLYIFAGEDLPEGEAEAQEEKQEDIPKPEQRVSPSATVDKGSKVPVMQKGMTDEQRFVSCCVAHMKQEIEGFNFPEMRKTMIAEKVIADKSSAEMTMDEAFWMIVKLYQRFANMAEDEAKAKVTGMMDMFFQETSK